MLSTWYSDSLFTLPTPVTSRSSSSDRHTQTVSETVMQRQPDGLAWEAEAEADDGDMYWFVADGVGPLLDPDAMDVVMTADGPRSVVRTTWPKQPSLGMHHHDPIVYELHVRGFAKTFAGCIDRLRISRRPRGQRHRTDAGAPLRSRRQLLGLHAAGLGSGSQAVRSR